MHIVGYLCEGFGSHVVPNTPPSIPTRRVLNFTSKDGAVLLAKYLEHQATAMQRYCHDELLCGDQSDAFCPRNEKNGETKGISDETNSDHNGCSNSHGRTTNSTAVRVLELGCGTGLAGLAAAFAFGKQRCAQSKASLCSPPQGSRPSNGEGGRVDASGSPAAEGEEVQVVLTDLEYALANARANIARNACSLEDVGAKVDAVELDWCRPLPQEFAGEAGALFAVLAIIVFVHKGLAHRFCFFSKMATCRGKSTRRVGMKGGPSSFWHVPGVSDEKLTTSKDVDALELHVI